MKVIWMKKIVMARNVIGTKIEGAGIVYY